MSVLGIVLGIYVVVALVILVRGMFFSDAWVLALTWPVSLPARWWNSNLASRGWTGEPMQPIGELELGEARRV